MKNKKKGAATSKLEEAEEEHVSGAHAVYKDDDELDVCAMDINEKNTIPSSENASAILELEEVKKNRGELGECLSYPPVDSKPASEYDETLQIMVNTFPWLFLVV